MNNKTVHWIFTGVTALAGIWNYLSPFVPPTVTAFAIPVFAGVNALLHTFFPSGDPTAPSAQISGK